MSAPLPEFVPLVFVRPPDMTDEEAAQVSAWLGVLPQRFILGATT